MPAFRIPAVTVSVVAVLLGCANSSGSRTGKALSAEGPQLSGTLGFAAVSAGTVYRFAFPQLRNVTGRPLELTGFSVSHVDSGVAVVGYPVYSVDDTHQYLVTDIEQAQNPTSVVDLATARDYGGRPLEVAPHQLSPYVATVRVRLTNATKTQRLRTCVVTYRQGGTPYSQSFFCEFQLGDTS